MEIKSKDYRDKREIHRGEIYVYDFGQQGGSLQRGIRPALIIQNDRGNKYSTTTIVVPITSRMQKYKKLPTHVEIATDKCIGLKQDSYAILEQLYTVEQYRLGNYIGQVNTSIMKEIDNAIDISLGTNEIISDVEKTAQSKAGKIKNIDIVLSGLLTKVGTDNCLVKEFLLERYDLYKDFQGYCRINRLNSQTYYTI